MPAFIADNALMLILAVAGFWFTARFLVGPKRGAPGLGIFFRRERAVRHAGLGKEAIATLIEDTRQMVLAAPDLRGLVLAGPFAVQAATSQSAVSFMILCEAIEPYSGKVWLARWNYPARGHAILEHRIVAGAMEALHLLNLRGSPPIRLHFVRMDSLAPPPTLIAAMREGAATLDDPSGLAEKLRIHWREQAQKKVA